ncbi:hypothetical protein AVEN_26308-1 [Araneus ventricosus]|uniref:Uncharacterized protein n=1 Tax=Araneus ventricosus TaxID=182803 RepID=A0A4Y2AM44_ARAVE|nr:hypothetical protein AVEN_26308-1 [Araneus ventricosus]
MVRTTLVSAPSYPNLHNTFTSGRMFEPDGFSINQASGHSASLAKVLNPRFPYNEAVTLLLEHQASGHSAYLAKVLNPRRCHQASGQGLSSVKRVLNPRFSYTEAMTLLLKYQASGRGVSSVKLCLESAILLYRSHDGVTKS